MSRLQLKMSFLQDELGVTDAQVLKILVRSPKLLSLGVENLRRKRTYFEEGLHLNADDVRSAKNAASAIQSRGGEKRFTIRGFV